MIGVTSRRLTRVELPEKSREMELPWHVFFVEYVDYFLRSIDIPCRKYILILQDGVGLYS